MDTVVCTLNLVLACQIDYFSIGKYEDVHGRPEEVMVQRLMIQISISST